MTEVPYHIIVKSRDVSVDSCLGILERVNHSVVNSRGRIREGIRFTEPEKMVDATTSFMGAFTRPIPLKNFAEGSDDLVGLVRYSKWQPATDQLEHELLATSMKFCDGSKTTFRSTSASYLKVRPRHPLASNDLKTDRVGSSIQQLTTNGLKGDVSQSNRRRKRLTGLLKR